MMSESTGIVISEVRRFFAIDDCIEWICFLIKYMNNNPNPQTQFTLKMNLWTSKLRFSFADEQL